MILMGLASLSAVATAQSQESKSSASLENVLKKMDAAASNFRTTQADFVWEQYQKVVDDKDTQKGTVHYRRAARDIEMMAEVKEPERKYVLFKDGKLQVYQPKIEQVMIYATGKNREEIESYLVLGFGGSGQDLLKAFEVSYQGPESIDNVSTAKLRLIPKSEKLHNTFKEIFLWIDLERGISVQQQFFEPQGDYRLAKYSSIRLNEKIPAEVFQLKTTGKTQIVSPRG